MRLKMSAEDEIPVEAREGVRSAADAADCAEPNPRRPESKDMMDADPDDDVDRSTKVSVC